MMDCSERDIYIEREIERDREEGGGERKREKEGEREIKRWRRE